MAPKFGTSGLRGLVTELTADLVEDYTRSFLAACPTVDVVYVGQDLRPSSPDIASFVIKALLSEGCDVVDCGAVPTPALALACMKAGAGAVMVTGSHIPADRNGLKFYVPSGEISKADEAALTAHLGRAPSQVAAGVCRSDDSARAEYVGRYVQAFGSSALAGIRIGVYQHSSVARDIMTEVVTALGGVALPLSRSDTFIPVDTEALDPDTQAMFAAWCKDHDLKAVISTDCDADRPMVADEAGRVIPGDVLGTLTSLSLGAERVCTPVSSNTMVQQMEQFGDVLLTKIGSPYVIAAMEDVLAADPDARVVGYEANGGFLLGFEAEGPFGPLAPLMTRDCLLPMLAPLAMAYRSGQTLAELVAGLPDRFTAADRLQGVEPSVAAPFLQGLCNDAEHRAAFFGSAMTEAGMDLTDGMRVRFVDEHVIHLRPSGNAPEFRCYAEADSAERAKGLVEETLDKLRAVFDI